LSILAPSTKKPSYVTVSFYMLFFLKDKEQSFVDLKKGLCCFGYLVAVDATMLTVAFSCLSRWRKLEPR
jgi:hypothetical protein